MATPIEARKWGQLEPLKFFHKHAFRLQDKPPFEVETASYPRNDRLAIEWH